MISPESLERFARDNHVDLRDFPNQQIPAAAGLSGQPDRTQENQGTHADNPSGQTSERTPDSSPKDAAALAQPPNVVLALYHEAKNEINALYMALGQATERIEHLEEEAGVPKERRFKLLALRVGVKLVESFGASAKAKAQSEPGEATATSGDTEEGEISETKPVPIKTAKAERPDPKMMNESRCGH